LKYLNQKNFLFHIKKTQLSSCEHKIYILMGFQFYIEKIKISSSVHIINFDMGLVTNKKRMIGLSHKSRPSKRKPPFAPPRA
jgi:hypothetical protein